ncbi:MAG TPA: DUF1343 domain-containing protein [Bacteroidia bacterium]|nr:DUF1343 domain-containing protein [Bacteroidia bacterium]
MLLLASLLCFVSAIAQNPLCIRDYSTVVAGDQQFSEYLPLLKAKRVAVLTNGTGRVAECSLVDTLLKLNVNVVKIFGPEHGFRGKAEAGEQVHNGKDRETGLQVISLYGKNKKPTREQLRNVDVLLFDIQDVGVRFYTYLSTLAYAMEACAENGKEMIVLDRPNPNGFYVDGPVLEDEFRSFLGLHKVPLVYGMTIAEYAGMLNGEGWLKADVKCRLVCIKLKNYERRCAYKLPFKPSPNLPDEKSILLYPSLGLFEGSIMSVGRGTEKAFQLYGHPEYPVHTFSFIPRANAVSTEPKYLNQTCYGEDLSESDYLVRHPRRVNLSWLIGAYGNMGREDFFDLNFNYHAGNSNLKRAIVSGEQEEMIRKAWAKDLAEFRIIRSKYLLYPDND